MDRGSSATGGDAASSRAAAFVYAVLLVFLGARIAAWLSPTMWLWGLNTQRFVAGPLSLLLVTATALPFLGPAGDGIGRRLDRAGETLRTARTARIVAALAFALAVFLLDDRTFWTGDALIRHAATDSPQFLARFAQALPLELLLYERLPLALEGLLPAGMLSRLIGLVAAFALAIAALGIAREAGARGARLVAAASLVAFGGHLATFTGLGKPAALLCALTALAAWQGLRVVGTGRGRASLGSAVFAAIVLHRAGVMLLPAWASALACSLDRRRDDRRPRAGTEWAFALLPIGALALVGHRVLAIATSIDVPTHVAAPGAWPWRALDLANLALALIPAAVPVVIVGPAIARAWAASRETLVLLALAVPAVAGAAVLTPSQGLFRDLDFFAPGAVALAALGAWVLTRLHGQAAGAGRLDGAVTLGSAGPALLLLCCFHDPAGGLQRVSAYLRQAPHRSAAEREQAWDFVALQAFGRRDWPLAAAACEQAARLAPSLRMLIMLGISRTYVRDYAGAGEAYQRAIERSPDEVVAWAGLAGIATRLGDHALADSAMAEVRRFPETSVKAREVRALIHEYPEFSPR